MEIKKILDKRTIVMGVSMLMVMIFHSDLPIISSTFIYKNLHIGVDCFLFLSGLGIVQSLNKNDNIKEFYKRRIVRILPTTIPLIVIFSYLMLIFNEKFTMNDFNLQITSLNFFLGKGNFPYFMWYIPCIMIYYFLSPFLFKFLKNNYNNDNKFIIKMFLILLILFIIPTGIKVSASRNIFLRFPVYLLGMVYGFRIINKEVMTKKEIILTITLGILSILGVYYLENNYHALLNHFIYCLYIPIVLLLTITITYLYDRFKLPDKLLTLVGVSTLAIYCSHEFIKMITNGFINKYSLYNHFNYNVYIFSLLYFIVGLIFGISWTFFINYLTKKEKVK
ncbi:MAG: acyltransferase [Bacilli bacterium]|nr:acyltransferase [Bacilli bacterium]